MSGSNPAATIDGDLDVSDAITAGSTVTCSQVQAGVSPNVWLAGDLNLPNTGTNSNTLSAVSVNGDTAGLFATQSSDNQNSGPAMVPAMNIFAFNNKGSGSFTSYGIYAEVRHFENSGFTQGCEFNATNVGSQSVTCTPYAFGEAGFCGSFTASSGRDDIYGSTGQSNPSFAYGILGSATADVGFNSGIVFAAGSVRTEYGIDMPQGVGVIMRAPNNAIAGRIRCDATVAEPNAAAGASLIFTNTGLTIQDLNGTAQLGLGTNGITIGSTCNAAAVVTNSLTASAASTGNLTATGHMSGSGGAAPTVSAPCGLASGSSDTRGNVALPAGTQTATVTFATPFASAPFAVATSVSPGVVVSANATTTALTITIQNANQGAYISYFCIQ